MTSSPTPARSVHKFGGASLADGAGVRRVGAILAALAPNRPIAVVSAIEGVTTLLDSLARAAANGSSDLSALRVRHRSVLAQLELDSELLNRHFAELATVLRAIEQRGELTAQERDHALSFGERASARIVAAHLSSRGVRAVPIDAFDLGLISDSNHGRARVLPQSAERIRSALARIDGIPVITGFVAQDQFGRLTTLGRNGSDLSASLIAEAASASEACFWKEVGGVMSADPKLVPAASVLRKLSYSQAAELTLHGAGVLHAESIHPLARAGIPGRVLCVREPKDPGTIVGSEARSTNAVGIACRRALAFVRVSSSIAVSELHAKLAPALAAADVEPLHMENVDDELHLIAPWSDGLARCVLPLASRVTFERELATVAALGANDAPALMRRFAQGAVDVRTQWSAGSHATPVFVVREAQLSRAAQIAHKLLFEEVLIEGGSR